MQRKDESPKPSRPSLLTPAQQEEADRNRILSTLESGGGAGKPAAKRGRSRLAWAALGVAMLAIAVGIGTYVTREKAHSEVMTSVAAASKDLPPAAAASPAPAVAAEVSADEVLASAAPAAVINDDAAAQQAPAKQESLSEMLNAGGEPAAKPSHDVLSKALETPSAGAPAPAKSAAKPVQKPKPKPAAKESKKAPAEPATTPEQESDIALLSALVAHAQAAEKAEAAKKPRLSVKEQLAQCKKFGKTKAAECRARICEGRTKTGDCKVAK
ncbi:hypothetical protein SAMN05428959_1012 [Duganella sp. CF517]|uniref:hypothetical protein n=1 Tax=Duganella sp. CF517 TaxID=1881038 RepID=UPI0008BBC99D|nr:hypothetical protein [Duganella sp. CF517]SEN05843.1 hypothetical protein SAMN05428959_1012 [Duganella sp. CF517]